MAEDNFDRQMVLNKGSEKYIFRYIRGQEQEVLESLMLSAKDKGLSFDWFDAAVLSFKLSQSLIEEADVLIEGSRPEITEAF